MDIMIDHERVQADDLGLQTIGQMLSHLRKGNRLVVQLLVDGEQPDLDRLGEVRQLPLSGHSVFVETVCPSEMAIEVLDAVRARLEETDQLKTQAVELLRQDQSAAAMQRLTGCFASWHNAQESLHKTAQLMKLDLEEITAGGLPLTEMLEQFKEQLSAVREALEDRDFVRLSDTLCYEMADTTQQWMAAIDALHQQIAHGPAVAL